jgi:hypothetical protein
MNFQKIFLSLHKIKMPKYPMNRFLFFLIISICLSSCKEKADINKLYNETEECFELTFKYTNVNGIDYASVTEDDVYRMEYDKVRSRFHIWTIRFADLRITETFYVRLNKFHCTETQICFDNADTRVIIENAGDYYIVHIYKLRRYSRVDSRWEDWVTFHNSSQRVRSRTANNSSEQSSDEKIATSRNEKEKSEPIKNQNIFTVVYAISDDGFLNIREQPSSKAKVLGKLHGVFDGLGEGVLIEKGDSWSKVSTKGIVGWVYTKYLGYQTWYEGTGSSILIANLPQTPIYEDADVAEEDYKLTSVKKGTIIADSFKDAGKYYALQTAGTCLRVKKEDVKIVSRSNK